MPWWGWVLTVVGTVFALLVIASLVGRRLKWARETQTYDPNTRRRNI